MDWPNGNDNWWLQLWVQPGYGFWTSKFSNNHTRSVITCDPFQSKILFQIGDMTQLAHSFNCTASHRGFCQSHRNRCSYLRPQTHTSRANLPRRSMLHSSSPSEAKLQNAQLLTFLHSLACWADPTPISSVSPWTARLCWMPQDQNVTCEATPLAYMATALRSPPLAILHHHELPGISPPLLRSGPL